MSDAPLSPRQDPGMVGVFARADHPNGWGWAAPGERGGRAHGYVIVFVRCDSADQLGRVAQRLAREPFYGRDGQTYQGGLLAEWFGGRFDFIGSVPDVEVPYSYDGRFSCRGDNRMIAVYDADEVLAPILDEGGDDAR